MTTCNRLAVLVTGSRGWRDVAAIEQRLSALPYQRHRVLLHGDAEGADTIAHRFGTSNGWLVERTMYFDWLGKSGGHVRNVFMLEKLKLYEKYGYLCSVEAFSLGTPGTASMIKIAEKAGFVVHVTRGTAT